MTAKPQCTVNNGSYTCRQDEGHEGHHVARYSVNGEWRLAIFADKYSEVEYVRSAVQESVR